VSIAVGHGHASDVVDAKSPDRPRVVGMTYSDFQLGFAGELGKFRMMYEEKPDLFDELVVTQPDSIQDETYRSFLQKLVDDCPTKYEEGGRFRSWYDFKIARR
jgi:hypothetical protein